MSALDLKVTFPLELTVDEAIVLAVGESQLLGQLVGCAGRKRVSMLVRDFDEGHKAFIDAYRPGPVRAPLADSVGSCLFQYRLPDLLLREPPQGLSHGRSYGLVGSVSTTADGARACDRVLKRASP